MLSNYTKQQNYQKEIKKENTMFNRNTTKNNSNLDCLNNKNYSGEMELFEEI